MNHISRSLSVEVSCLFTREGRLRQHHSVARHQELTPRLEAAWRTLDLSWQACAISLKSKFCIPLKFGGWQSNKSWIIYALPPPPTPRDTAEPYVMVLQATRLKKEAKAMQTAVEESSRKKVSNWLSFESTLSVLIQAGALDPGTLKATSLGEVAREISADNELRMSLVVTHPSVQVGHFNWSSLVINIWKLFLFGCRCLFPESPAVVGAQEESAYPSRKIAHSMNNMLT